MLHLDLGISLLLLLSNAAISEKVCRGTSFGLNTQAKNSEQYQYYKQLYTNCTIVYGNLELVFMESATYDFSFLRNIREVVGYVLIVSVFADTVPLENLRVIRGQTLYTDPHTSQSYSLYVAINYSREKTNVGLKTLPLTSLHEILAGDVLFANNNLLCHVSTIDWSDILTHGARVEFHNDTRDKHISSTCEPCDLSCSATANGSSHCWGVGPNMCQRLTKVICSPQCEGHCYGYQPNQCCHPECAGGCTGPRRRDCWSCKNFNNNGSCEALCPPLLHYNPHTYRHEPNPDAKFAYGTLCVDTCPEHLMISEGACVTDCGEGRSAGEDRQCRLTTDSCVDGTCAKVCSGLPEELTADNIEQYRNCTVIDGAIVILHHSIYGDEPNDVPGLHPSQLNILKSVTEVTHYVTVQANHPDLRDLGFLSNLRVIHGRERDYYGNALHVQDTAIEQLGLTSLESIKFGNVIVAGNRQLCFADTINWSSLLTRTGASADRQKFIVTENRPISECREVEQVCDRQCAPTGCWGGGDSQCVTCLNKRQADRCVETCDMYHYDAGNNTCLPCDTQCTCHNDSTCNHVCHGPGPDNCVQCLHYKDGPFCVAECPQSKYADEHNNCSQCHPNCVDGCTGPGNTLGPGACTSCAVVMTTANLSVTQCLPDDVNCPRGSYSQRFSTGGNNSDTAAHLTGMQVCTRCHDQCEQCSDPSDVCDKCVRTREAGRCVTSCSPTHYLNVTTMTCDQCHQHCLTCYGPTHLQCFNCRLYTLYHGPNGLSGPRECVDKCPASAPQVEHQPGLHGNHTDVICLPASRTVSRVVSVGVAVSVLTLTLPVAVLVFVYIRRKRQRESLLTTYFSQIKPSAKPPDMSHIRLIKQSDIRRGHIIGSGAFGTVYRGVWIPAGQNVGIPVAIKVLQEDAGQAAELLDEARVMASVNDTYCVPIVAICMTAQLMLLTQLMPHGSLLDYVRAHKSSVDSHTLLIWATQIAKGMHYLEERGIVHRDLAARNVLVQKPHHVRITDFGLAKLLDSKHSEFKSQGGRMPIKWLAVECIRYRTFTHKSDVWSYGVTLWEIFTFGERPFENVRARDIVEMLERGERLLHPHICTIDVYMVMVKCWTLDAKSRPSFDELVTTFEQMSSDPARYLVIEGDARRQLSISSSTDCDQQNLLQLLSDVEDGPEHLMNADDYLNINKITTPSDSSYPVMPALRDTSSVTSHMTSSTRMTSLSDTEEIFSPLLRSGRPSASDWLTGSFRSANGNAPSSVSNPNWPVNSAIVPVTQHKWSESGYLEPVFNNNNADDSYLVVLPGDESLLTNQKTVVMSHDNPEYVSSPPMTSSSELRNTDADQPISPYCSVTTVSNTVFVEQTKC